MSDTSPRPVILPEPMLRYACNQQGCCCQGWRIPFKPHDLVRLGRYLPADRLTTNVDTRYEISSVGERVVRDVSILDEAGRCQFLEADHRRCTVHATHGVDALPDICVDFPVASYASGSTVDFFFDPVCPSVLDQLAESDKPLRLASVPPAEQDRSFQRRATHLHATPILRLGAVELTGEQFDSIRRQILFTLADDSHSPLEHQHAIDAGYAEVANGQPFVLRYDRDPKPYQRFFRQCLSQHGVGTLESVFRDYRRFLFAIPHDSRSGAWDELGKHLRQWEAALERWYTPGEQALRPLLRRYLAHRHATPFLTIGSELNFAAGTIVHMLATALRFTAAFGAVLRRPVDREVMKAALGASEYVYRALEIAPASLPWYGVSS